jgi:starch-binding outer membrane protein, SusD/RagB family
MLKKYKIILSWLSIFILLIGCKKFVEIPPPDTQIVTASVFNNSSTATAALIAIYTQMFSNQESPDMAVYEGLLSDELTNYSISGTSPLYLCYTNGLLSVNNFGPWNDAYNYIYECNAIIEALQNNGNISRAVAQQLTGEALFIRAFWYFYLTNLYGDVPLVTTTLYTTNASLSRTSQKLVYTQVISDLRTADSLLNANYVDASDTAITTERVRPTKGAAEAMLARAYLYTGNKYDSALYYSSEVINNSLYQLCTNLSGPNSVFLANSTEAIWQLSTPLPTNFNTNDAQDFILFTPPASSTGFLCSISPELLNSFESGDQRMTNWLGVYTTPSPAVNYYFPYKYQAFNLGNTGTVTEYTMVLRLAEQYLIRVEAEANLGNMTAAATDLNTIRTRAGLGASPTLTASSSLQQADSAILHERQVELFTEWGHRWFDLIRMDSANVVLGPPGNVCQEKGGVWSPNWQLFPIPQTEIQNDPHLKQNPGY